MLSLLRGSAPLRKPDPVKGTLRPLRKPDPVNGALRPLRKPDPGKGTLPLFLE